MEKFKQYKKYKDSGIEWLGKVPSHWDINRMDAYTKYYKKSIEREALRGKTVFYYSIPAIEETGDGVVEEGSNIDSNKLLLKGEELLVSKLNPRKGRIIPTKEKEMPIICSSEFVPLVPRNCSREFIRYIYQSELVKQKLSSAVQSATNSHQRVNPRDISKIYFAFPSKSEQDNIVKYLNSKTSQIDSLINKKQNLIEKLQEYKQSLITHTVTKGLDPNVKMKDSGVEWIGEVPEHWEILKGKYLLDIYNGYPPEELSLSANGQVKYIQVDDLNTENDELVIKDSKLKLKNKKTEALDHPIILIPKRGAAIFTNKVKILVDKGLIDSNIMGLKPKKNCNIHYLVYMIKARKVDDIADTSTIPQINNKHINPLPLTIPPIEEQNKIAEYLDEKVDNINNCILNIKVAIQKLKEYRQSLITHAVTGKIDVRDWADAKEGEDNVC
ncbi:restriction endonuclease subunit S [Natranaerobius thermophilus]|uniref:Restriction modification system DNA specificity domain n=1 Tax=Natranaerobius thermophilus (strain ATCC BAA-1301 / DSM 18059 / JW/NM-WN-LF) TaxID=457570 RepID=B2A7T1_NATTJ|nr:restriction endonuclease subunit S [Natranaerobius thermophilus]ACB84383.1 restriction modification system DNA specificity domain [Natranaerobius thermophilus JW/NM-WN-LF]